MQTVTDNAYTRENLSLEARCLAEQLRLLARYGFGPLGAVTLDKPTMAKFAAAAEELFEAVVSLSESERPNA